MTQTAKNGSERPILYSIIEAAQILRISPRTVRRELSEGALKGARLGKRRLLIPESELNRYVRASMMREEARA